MSAPYRRSPLAGPHSSVQLSSPLKRPPAQMSKRGDLPGAPLVYKLKVCIFFAKASPDMPAPIPLQDDGDDSPEYDAPWDIDDEEDVEHFDADFDDE